LKYAQLRGLNLRLKAEPNGDAGLSRTGKSEEQNKGKGIRF
jgi:hypothetical protein